MRYQLLESVAAYGTERLREAGELDRFQRGHRQFYTALAEQARSQLRGDSQRQWLQRLDRESANIRSALDGAIRHREADLALRLAGAQAAAGQHRHGPCCSGRPPPSGGRG